MTLFRLAASWVLVTALFLLAIPAPAQQLPPIEPPRQMPGNADATTTIRVTTREVLVPTLVEKPDGSVVYGLRQPDFIL